MPSSIIFWFFFPGRPASCQAISDDPTRRRVKVGVFFSLEYTPSSRVSARTRLGRHPGDIYAFGCVLYELYAGTAAVVLGLTASGVERDIAAPASAAGWGSSRRCRLWSRPFLCHDCPREAACPPARGASFLVRAAGLSCRRAT